MNKGPCRGDQVGSLLRPDYLKTARLANAAGRVSAEELRALEDAAISNVVALQEEAGMQAITDGEFRRAFWHVDFLTSFEGVDSTKSDYSVSFKGAGGAQASTNSMIGVTGKISRTKPIMRDSYLYLKQATSRTPKVCIPPPLTCTCAAGAKWWRTPPIPTRKTSGPT